MATTTSISCPECGAVLRPAKPLRAGKSVKCPKCGAGFVVGGEDEPPAASPPKAKGKAPSPVQKKPAGKPVAVAPIMPDDDDDDGGGTYSVTAEAKDDGPAVDYDPDMGVRDLRGPAMMAVVDPSNKMILAGVLGFLGWLGFLVALLIPLLFPLQTKADRDAEREAKEKALAIAKIGLPKDMAMKEEPKRVEEDSSIFKIGSLDLRDIAELPWYLIVLCLLPQVLGLVYSATMSMGAVKVQNLESREWGVAASVMAMVPLNVGGLLCVTALGMNILLGLVFDEGDPFRWFVMGFFLVSMWASNLALGIWMLTLLNKPEVIAGFEYVAE